MECSLWFEIITGHREAHHVKQSDRKGNTRPVRKSLKSRGFRKGAVNQCVLVRISTGELGAGSKVAEAGVSGKKPRVHLLFFAVFPRKQRFSRLRKLS